MRTLYAGELQRRRNRLTGRVVSIFLATPARLDPGGGPYVTVCEAHGTLCNHATLALARLAASFPDFCEACHPALGLGEPARFAWEE